MIVEDTAWEYSVPRDKRERCVYFASLPTTLQGHARIGKSIASNTELDEESTCTTTALRLNNVVLVSQGLTKSNRREINTPRPYNSSIAAAKDGVTRAIQTDLNLTWCSSGITRRECRGRWEEVLEVETGRSNLDQIHGGVRSPNTKRGKYSAHAILVEEYEALRDCGLSLS